MEYRWYKNGRIYVKSEDMKRKDVIAKSITQEYYDEYIGNQTHYEGHLNLINNSNVTSLGNLKRLMGGLYLSDNKINDLGDLEYVGRNLDLRRSNITSLGKIKSVGGNLNLIDVNITSLGKLEYVGRYIDCTKGSVIHELLMDSKFKDIVYTSG